MASKEMAERLRALHQGPRALVLCNVWDAAGARLMEDMGYPAVATTSGGIAVSHGYPDGAGQPAAMRDQLHESVLVSLADGAIEAAELAPCDLRRRAPAGARLGGRQADLRDLGIGEGDARHERRLATRPAGQQGVARRLKRLPARQMRKLRAGDGVAAGPNVARRRPQPAVDLDASRGGAHSRDFQTQSVERRPPSRGDEQKIGGHGFRPGSNRHRFTFLSHFFRSVFNHANSFPPPHAQQHLACTGSLLGQDLRGDDHDFRAQAAVGLRDFATHRSAADDRHASRQARIGKDGLVSEVGNLIQVGQLGNRRRRAGGD